MDKDLKHSKIKNPAIVFELLLRKLTSDTINGNETSPALSIIKEFFNKKTQLGKEYDLYQLLVRNKFSNETKANILLEHVLESRKTLNEKFLRNEKYNVIKKIREYYDINKFFDTKLDNYKLYASIYKLFENKNNISAIEIIKEKFQIIEHIVSDRQSPKNQNELIESFESEHKDVRLIAYRILVDKFNKKYSSKLDDIQKSILREYIYSASNSSTLLDSIKGKIPKLSKELKSYIGKVDDKVTQIKLKETVLLLNKFNNIKFIKDEDILGFLRYYELLKEIKKIHK